jgi:hypothetical protein
VNAITKSGGNLFSGSYRLNLANEAWSTETPYERANNVTRVSKVNTVHEATFGGPLVQDRLWFFTAGRYTDAQKSNTLPFTATQYLTTDRNTRAELKLTGTMKSGHALQASALRNPREQSNQANLSGGLATIDPFALRPAGARCESRSASASDPRVKVQSRGETARRTAVIEVGSHARAHRSPFSSVNREREPDNPLAVERRHGRRERVVTASLNDSMRAR